MQEGKAKWTSKIHPGWRPLMKKVFASDLAKDLGGKLKQLSKDGFEMVPAYEDVFNAFSYRDPKDIRVVIVAQDPYPTKGLADGLAFSVNKGRGRPPSLENIFAEIRRDIPGTVNEGGSLACWAKQGVLLLNSIMTTRVNTPGAHADFGWEQMTDEILVNLQEINPKIVYLLWGNFAKLKAPLIERSLGVLKSSHPSPRSVDLGFSGCGHFSKANQLLKEAGLEPIDWSTAID